MRVHYLQHVPFESLGSIEGWLHAQGADITRTRLFLGEALPNLKDFDWLIVMGGSMGVGDEGEFPWLKTEKRLISETVAAKKPVLGICLGAQLLASALGARVYKNRHREIGWFPIERTPLAAAHPIGQILPNQADVFHWHGDTFDLPEGAVHLARSEACENQCFAFGDCAVGLQFHLEMTASTPKSLISHCPDDLAEGPYVQTPAQMLENEKKFGEINQVMFNLLSYLSRFAV
ncbi:MAG: type 1 glutamine amidotransferase [Chlorobiales bacterium]|nr:type 1 glutamine amidotransferase [Chlorobiales bacterium]